MADNPRIEELRRRVQADPASIAFAALAEEYRRMGRYDDAVATCRAGLQRHPAYLSARVTLGRALIETGEFDAAREELDTVLRSAPENLAAIRGLAQIDERLGHSAEMDPHLADMMKTMHAESIRVAAMVPPVPPAPVAPPTVNPMAPQPEPEPEPALAMNAAPEPVEETPPSTDPFAGFAQISQPASAPEYSFDLGTTFTIEPEPAAEMAVDLDLTAAIDAAAAPGPAAPFADVPAEPEQELALEPFLEAAVEPVFEPSRLTTAPVPVIPAPQADEGPDPQMLATLARLERFLDAIQSLRA
jgi:tetratricopeptide (TPR) repeat protein